MSPAGVLLDTGPLVALLSARDRLHDVAVRAVADCEPPLRCCEAVLTEACFLVSRRGGQAADVIALARSGALDIGFDIEESWSRIEGLLKRYANVPMSFADACLVAMAESWNEPRILTFDADFGVYRWSGRKPFHPLAEVARN